ncbi:hypothetical protein PG989_000015 [Apiospora arundinis]
MEALVLFEACLTGHISHVPRRPHDRERANLICSGNVFIYEEHQSCIKQWTDGVPWSPSRVLGNFLLYRELDKPFQPGEKNRAMKKEEHQRRTLVGSLVVSYQFKPDGLVKKTISVQYKGIQHHLVSYYNLEDVVQKKLRTPLESGELQHIQPRAALISAGNFRAPVEDHEFIMDDCVRVMITQSHLLPGMSAYGAGSRSMFVPNVHPDYQPPGWPIGYPMQPNSYAVAPHNFPPPPVPYPHPPPGCIYEAPRMPARPSNFPSMQMPSRRHSTIANNGYDTDGSAHNSYGPMSSLSRSPMSNTPVVPTSGMPSSSMLDGYGMGHGSFGA